MPKTAPAGKVRLDHDTFEANAVPDAFDARDLEYRPRLEVLPREVDYRPEARYVMKQQGSSCTGHAVAAMINAILASQSDDTRVSPYMLYALARRYDEFEGESDAGSSLRGAMKGWFNHGVLPERKWRTLHPACEPDLDLDETIARLALDRPLGAFYRVNTTRLDDMQSAITELFGIVVSASIHDGWYSPEVVTRTTGRETQTMHVIKRTDASKALGGHAFSIVGYNDVGFLVQNSWGSEWAAGGFATLTYDDWLESGYDAWVARPGVPSVVSMRMRRKILGQSSGLGFVEAPGPDLQRLSKHVVNLGNNGRLSQNGKFISTKTQIESIFTNMAETHSQWDSSARRIVLYAHGGLNSEQTGLDIAQRQLDWWLSNQIYPITFAWQTGVTETLQSELSDLIGRKAPAGATFNLFEQIDRVVEKTAKRTLRWMWDEMKDNAAGACDDLQKNWRRQPNHDLPGASLVVEQLRQYVDGQPKGTTEVHLVGHSAGAIFLTGIIEQLTTAGIQVESLTYLAAALRTDQWMRRVLPRLKHRDIRRFTAFGLSTQRELDDVCGARSVAIYRKSLLYLVSRAFEPSRDETEVPLVGMAHCADDMVDGKSFNQAVKSLGDAAALVWSPSAKPSDNRSDAMTHGGFDDDSPTMTSVLLRILGSKTVQPGNEYGPNLSPGTSSADLAKAATTTADMAPEITIAEVQAREPPLGYPPAAAAAPTQMETTSAVRVGAHTGNGSGNRVIDALLRTGWKVATDGAAQREPDPPQPRQPMNAKGDVGHRPALPVGAGRKR